MISDQAIESSPIKQMFVSIQICFFSDLQPLSLPKSTTVLDLRLMLESIFNIDMKYFALMHKKMFLLNEKKTLSELAVSQNDLIELVKIQEKGFQFNDFRRKILTKLTKQFNIEPGLIFFGLDKNEKCPNFQKLVPLCLGFGVFNIGKIQHKQLCPSCHQKLYQIKNIGFYKCEYNIQGSQEEDDKQFYQKFITSNNSVIYSFLNQEKDLIRWSYLIIEVFPLKGVKLQKLPYTIRKQKNCINFDYVEIEDFPILSNVKITPRQALNKISLSLYDKILNEPPTQEVLQRSDYLEEKLMGQIDLNLGLIAMKHFAEQILKAKLVFTTQPSLKAQMSFNVLTSPFLFRKKKYLVKFEEFYVNFSKLQKDFDYLKQFVAQFTKIMAAKYKIFQQSIKIHKIQRGSVQVIFSNQDDNKDSQEQNKLQLHPFFQYFQLNINSFDPKGNMQYSDHLMVDERGGWPYFLPINCKRYGLNVENKYGDNNWLMMDGNQQEWAVAFHGVRGPQFIHSENVSTQSSTQLQISVTTNKKVLNMIMQGQKGAELKWFEGGPHVFKDHKPINNSFFNKEQKIDYGVYLSPHIHTCLDGYTTAVIIPTKKYKYHLVFQCRVNPTQIKVCPLQEDYWVVNKSEDIRPYGIILVKQNDVSNYPTAEQFYGDQVFTWEQYGQSVYENLKKKIETKLSS